MLNVQTIVLFSVLVVYNEHIYTNVAVYNGWPAATFGEEGEEITLRYYMLRKPVFFLLNIYKIPKSCN